MRNSAILKWTQNNKLLHKSSATTNGKPSWIHAPESLTAGHIAYLVKFLGRADVDQPKGIEVVKQGIQKLHFGQEIKKSECSKLPKRELTISINGVAIQDPKTKEILHQYPLHRISYCADDKGEKKFFSFIAKDSERDGHSCFVFVSDKLAEEITLTIGQAFDLAYRQFLDTSGRDLENKKQRMILQKQLATAHAECDELRRRLKDVSQLAPPAALHEYCRKQLILDLLKVSSTSCDENGDDTSSTTEVLHKNITNGTAPPPVPPRNNDTIDLISDFEESAPTVGTRLEGLLFSDLMSSSDSGGSSSEVNDGVNRYSPPPSSSNVSTLIPRPRASSSSPGGGSKDLFGAEPFSLAAPVEPPIVVRPPVTSATSGGDPFGMGSFNGQPEEMKDAISKLDRRISEMKAGFSSGLSFGTDDFSLDDLDPLKN